MEEKRKKKIIYSSLMGIIILLIIVGITYAWFSAKSEVDEHKITTAKTELIVEIDPSASNIKDINPTTWEDDIEINKANTDIVQIPINVINNSTIDVKYNLKLTTENLSLNNDVEIPGGSLSDIKYILYKLDDENKEVKRGDFTNPEEEQFIIKGKYINKEDTHHYILYVYIEESEEIQNSLQKLNFNIIINGDTKVPDNTYSQDGLLLYLDGINNTRTGHSDSTEIWEDLSENEKDGELKGFTYDDASGWIDNGLKFDGEDDGVLLGDKLKDLLKDDFTIEMVFNCDELNTRDILLGNYWEPYSVNFEINGNLFRLYWNSGIVDFTSWSPPLITDTNKLNISITLNKMVGTLNIYKNNKLIGTVTNENLTTYNYDYSPNVYLGKDNRNVGEKTELKGVINVVRIYNRKLSDDEIKNNYEKITICTGGFFRV